MLNNFQRYSNVFLIQSVVPILSRKKAQYYNYTVMQFFVVLHSIN